MSHVESDIIYIHIYYYRYIINEFVSKITFMYTWFFWNDSWLKWIIKDSVSPEPCLAGINDGEDLDGWI